MNKVVTAGSDIFCRPIAANAIKFLLFIFVLLEPQQSQKFSFFTKVHFLEIGTFDKLVRAFIASVVCWLATFSQEKKSQMTCTF